MHHNRFTLLPPSCIYIAANFNTFPFHTNYDLRLQLLPQLVLATSFVNLNTEIENFKRHILYLFQITGTVQWKRYLYFNRIRAYVVIECIKDTENLKTNLDASLKSKTL